MIKKAYVYKDNFDTFWLKVEYSEEGGGGSKAFKLEKPEEDLAIIIEGINTFLNTIKILSDYGRRGGEIGKEIKDKICLTNS